MNELIGAKRLAKIIGVSTTMINYYRKKGMPSKRIGIRNHKYNIQECQKWIKDFSHVEATDTDKSC